jgi:hypothetical protein
VGGAAGEDEDGGRTFLAEKRYTVLDVLDESILFIGLKRLEEPVGGEGDFVGWSVGRAGVDGVAGDENEVGRGRGGHCGENRVMGDRM